MPTLTRFLLFTLLLAGCDKNNLPDQQQRVKAGTDAVASLQQGSVANRDTTSTDSKPSAGYVGSKQCASCHQQEFQSWRGSHHDMAMKEASDSTVAGDFNDTQFDYYGTVSLFFKKDGRFFVRTDGQDGELHDFPVAYTFGVFPLQQYLVEFPNGKLQALSIAWDSRSKAEGGQRWFHLYPNEQIKPGDPLHWTGINQNWNFMCADCHSTNLQKNYDLGNQTYDTAWSEINVACEACHGPGSNHVQWANRPAPDIADKGLAVSYAGRSKAAWAMDAESGIARLTQAADTPTEIETCAQCHSRRSTAFPGAEAGGRLLDHFNLSLLAEPLYHADGQINDEVYVYGSFLQSKMHAAGVTCSNCHEPHSLQLRVAGNGLCGQCHLPAKFDTAEHHFHPADSSGAQCVSCHMPAKTYMQVDARRDHSFRIPRPDLSNKLQTPNACTGCHTEKANAWATAVLQDKFGAPPQKHYGEALYAGRHGLPGAESSLIGLIADESQPDIARATAVSLLPRYLSQTSLQMLQAIAQGDEPLLSLGLAQSLESVPEQIRPALGIPLLYEDDRVTSALAANALFSLPQHNYPDAVRQQLAGALRDYLASETFNGDRPESLTNLAGLHAQRGNPQQAEAFYRRALAIAPYYTPAYINLSELFRTAGREQDAEALLRDALEDVYDKAPIWHSLALSLIRQQRKAEALNYLRRAAESSNSSARFIYVYAIALNSAGNSAAALAALERGRQRFPGSREILSALASINRETGDLQTANKYEKMLR
ncbi:tetratricopeptide repeat protein [Microbulbifer marinus]|uniref:Cytochrome c554 and c-prime n=1 Tax=Microbulbifer marinus TaxID=658218 RepID=A0A1H3WBJ4_9GAMM|nr:tetratricopeptide repeat protein [Microbulbifer marinus]SDZ84499.1 Cytochrome c554 and c-prime [Microbulbifer marinus]